jgi:hypothetical protein
MIPKEYKVFRVDHIKYPHDELTEVLTTAHNCEPYILHKDVKYSLKIHKWPCTLPLHTYMIMNQTGLCNTNKKPSLPPEKA